MGAGPERRGREEGALGRRWEKIEGRGRSPVTEVQNFTNGPFRMQEQFLSLPAPWANQLVPADLPVFFLPPGCSR